MRLLPTSPAPSLIALGIARMAVLVRNLQRGVKLDVPLLRKQVRSLSARPASKQLALLSFNIMAALTNVLLAFLLAKVSILRSGFLGGEFSDYDVSVTLTTDSRMRGLNFAHRGRPASTDILTFRLADPPAATASDIAVGLPEMPGKLLPGAPYLCAKTGKQHEAPNGPWHLPKDLGDVFVNVQHSCRTASAEQVSLHVYLPVIITHGLAHLAGFTHDDQEAYCTMKKAERQALALLRRTHDDSGGLLDYAVHQTSSLESYLR